MTVKETLVSSSEQQLPWVQTPLVESYALSQAAGCRIFLKLENLQPSGSFKSRGIGNYILRRLEEIPPTSTTTPHIFCSSGGNAGLAAVHASRTLGLPCTVVVPVATQPLMVEKIKAAGAFEVVQYGAAWAEADAYMREELMPKAGPSTIYTPPFDHPDIWTGNSTLMHEIAAQLPPSPHPTTLVCSVGGGGLINGIAQALDTKTLPLASDSAIIGVETAGADSLNACLRANALVTLPRITSQATSLGCARVTPLTLAIARRPNVRSVVLSDGEAAMGCVQLADAERMMVELACGVNVAMCFGGRLERALGRKVSADERVVIVVCGGSGVTVEMLAKWRKEFGGLLDEKRKGEGEGEVRMEMAGEQGSWGEEEEEEVFYQAKI